MVILLATGWQLFLFLDGKIERKADYLNARIDNIHQGQLMQQQYPVPIQSTNNANNAEGALSEDSLPTNGSKIIQKTE